MPPLPVCVCRQGRAHSHVGGREGGREAEMLRAEEGTRRWGRLAGAGGGYFSRVEIESHTAAAVRPASSHSRFRKAEIAKL